MVTFTLSYTTLWIISAVLWFVFGFYNLAKVGPHMRVNMGPVWSFLLFASGLAGFLYLGWFYLTDR
jgi:hypothetical protein